MTDAIARLQSLRVRDIMNGEVVSVARHQSMADAAAIFSRHHISAAPVVDEAGKCVGILSASDFVTRELDSREGAQSHELACEDGDGMWRVVGNNMDLVGCCMQSAVQSVRADEFMLSAARIMSAQHVHRLPVIGCDERPVGIVSTMDILAALLNSVDEMNTR